MDIRQLYKSLSIEDRTIYQSIRTDMRKVYLNAHTNIAGMDKWCSDDDYFLDLLDIKIAGLFDRVGRVEGAIIDKDEKKAMENKLEQHGNTIQSKMNIKMSDGSVKLSAMPIQQVLPKENGKW